METLVWCELHWHRPVDAERAVQLLRRLASDGRSPRLVLEVRASAAGVRYLLAAPAAAIDEVQSLVRTLVPGTTMTMLRASARLPVVTARQVRASTRHRSLNGAQLLPTLRAVLGALTAPKDDEGLVLQVVLGPRRIPLAVPTLSPSSTVEPWYRIAWYGHGNRLDGEKRTALRAKVAEHGFAAAVRVGVRASSPRRRQQLLLGLLAALRTAESPGLVLRLTSCAASTVSSGHFPRWWWPLRLGASEVLLLSAWPVGEDVLPGLGGIHPRRLPPAPGTTGSKRVVAVSTMPGTRTGLQLTARDALHHLHVLGPTGVGKSVLLGRLVEQDMRAGRSIVVIEPKGDLVADVLAHVPHSRLRDVVVLDPLDSAPVGLNPLSVSGRADTRSEGLLAVFRSIYGDAIGPRSADILHSALLTLARRPDASLLMLPLLLTNAGFRRSVTTGLGDPIALEPFWAWYEQLSEGERAAAIAPVMNKLRPWLLNRSLRAVLGQRNPRFDLSSVFTERTILLVPLQKSVLGLRPHSCWAHWSWPNCGKPPPSGPRCHQNVGIRSASSLTKCRTTCTYQPISVMPWPGPVATASASPWRISTWASSAQICVLASWPTLVHGCCFSFLMRTPQSWPRDTQSSAQMTSRPSGPLRSMPACSPVAG